MLVPRSHLARIVLAACLPWYGVLLAGTATGVLSEGVGLAGGLVGALALAVAHEREAGDRWITGVALAALPALLLLAGSANADDRTGSSVVLVVLGLALAPVSLRAADRIRRRFGDAVDRPGGYGYYG